MTSQARTLTVFALGVGAALASGCGTAAPQAPSPTPAAAAQAPAPAPALAAPEPAFPVFAPPAVAQSALIGSIVSVAPSRIVGDLDALSRRLNLPVMLGQQLLVSLGPEGVAGKDVRLGELVDRIDPQSAVAVVWTLPQDRKAKGFCAALTLKDAALAKRTAEEMGAPGLVSGGVVERRTSEGDVLFTATKGRTLFISGSAEALLFAGGLAEAAQIPPSQGQVVLTALPQAMAKASRKSPKAIFEEFRTRARNGMAKDDTKRGAAAERFVMALLEGLTQTGLDSSLARMVLEAGPNDGLFIQAELVPASGTQFAARTAKRAPYAFDMRLPVKDDGTSALAVGDMSAWLSAMGKMLEATGPSGRAAARDTKAMLEATSEWSCVVEPAQLGIVGLCSAPLKQGVTAKKALDAAVASMASQHAWEAELEDRKPRPLKLRRSADTVEIEKKIESRDPSARALARAMAGGDLYRYAMTVKNGRLLMASGAKPKEMLARYGSGASVQEAPLVASALARSKGDEGMASVDVISLVLRLLGQGKGLPGAEMAAMVGAMLGVAGLKAPFRFALRGGGSLLGEFHIPLASLGNVAKVVQGILAAPPP